MMQRVCSKPGKNVAFHSCSQYDIYQKITTHSKLSNGDDCVFPLFSLKLIFMSVLKKEQFTSARNQLVFPLMRVS